MRFDLEELAKAPLRGNNPFAIVSANAEASEMVKRITSATGSHMPPAPRPSLSPQKIELVEEWINQGAPFQCTGASSDTGESGIDVGAQHD